jgi:hypothetical protein
MILINNIIMVISKINRSMIIISKTSISIEEGIQEVKRLSVGVVRGTIVTKLSRSMTIIMNHMQQVINTSNPITKITIRITTRNILKVMELSLTQKNQKRLKK